MHQTHPVPSYFKFLLKCKIHLESNTLRREINFHKRDTHNIQNIVMSWGVPHALFKHNFFHTHSKFHKFHSEKKEPAVTVTTWLPCKVAVNSVTSNIYYLSFLLYFANIELYAIYSFESGSVCSKLCLWNSLIVSQRGHSSLCSIFIWGLLKIII